MSRIAVFTAWCRYHEDNNPIEQANVLEAWLKLFVKLTYNINFGGFLMPAVATARIGARISPDLHQMLKRAAQIQGRSLSDFLIASARESALRAIKDHDIIHLSLQDQETVARSLLSPTKANPALRRAMKAHDVLIRSR